MGFALCDSPSRYQLGGREGVHFIEDQIKGTIYDKVHSGGIDTERPGMGKPVVKVYSQLVDAKL